MSGQASSSRQSSHPSLTPQQAIDLYTQNMPAFLNATGSQNPGLVAQSIENSRRQLSELPGYTAADIATQKQQAQGTADTLSDGGTKTATAADVISRATNPEYYASRSATSGKLNELFNSIKLGGLSGGEASAIERSSNQGNTATGNLGLANNTNTISNALNFGGAFNKKLGIADSAIRTGTNFMDNSRFDAPLIAGLAASQPSTTAASLFGNIQTTPNQALQFGSGLLGNITGLSTAPISTGKSNSAGGGIQCCFIFMESYNGKLPDFVRACRDYAYELYPNVAKGYCKMARWLVPAMQKSRIVRWLVNKTMVIPLTKYGGYRCGIHGYETFGKYKFTETFWFSVWNKLA